jgi:deoxyribodipyrimidine photo-lyase
LSTSRLGLYASKRNDPATPKALSGLSPYLHFGQLAPQRAALEAAKHRSKHKEAVESYLEELVVRRWAGGGGSGVGGCDAQGRVMLLPCCCRP